MKKTIFLITFVILNLQFATLSAQTPEIDSLENLLQKHTTEDTIRVNLLNEIAYKLYRIDIDKTLKYAEESMKIANNIGFEKGKAESFRLKGIWCWIKADYTKALENFEKALKINTDVGNKKWIAQCLNNIGSFNWQQGDYPQSLEYFHKSLKITEEIGNKQGISDCLNNIGIL